MLSHTGFGYSSDLLQSGVSQAPLRDIRGKETPREGEDVVLQPGWLTQLPLGQCCVLVVGNVVRSLLCSMNCWVPPFLMSFFSLQASRC